MMETSTKIAVLYLARWDGTYDHFKRFIASYLAHPADMRHDLYVLYKNMDDPDILAEAQHILAQADHHSLIVPDEGFDLGSYRLAASQIGHDYVCCLNTYSEILGDRWLKILGDGITPGVTELVGATGSHGSFGRPIYYFPYAKKDTALGWLKLGYQYVRRTVNLLRHWADTKRILAFPPFPNPHIRTNAFLIRRDLLLESVSPALRDKWDALEIESGKTGMTAGVRAKGFNPLVAGRDGRYYETNKWQDSRTFRSDGQDNLLVGDNRTREFEASSPLEKKRKRYVTWRKFWD